MLIMCALSVLAFALLLFVPHWMVAVGAMFLCMFCFGGFCSLLAPAASDAFGNANLSENFSIMFSVFGVAGFVGPMLLVTTYQSSGSYFPAFAIALGLSVFEVFLAVFYSKRLQLHKSKAVEQKI